MFFLLYIKVLMTLFKLTNFWRFSITFQRFPIIFQNCSEGQTNVSGHFSNISKDYWRLPKIAEDCRRWLKKMRRCFDHTSTNFSVVEGTKEKCYQIRYLHMCSEDIISSHVRISYRFYQFVTTWYTTDFYITKWRIKTYSNTECTQTSHLCILHV